jgi:hypothetical protein
LYHVRRFLNPTEYLHTFNKLDSQNHAQKQQKSMTTTYMKAMSIQINHTIQMLKKQNYSSKGA